MRAAVYRRFGGPEAVYPLERIAEACRRVERGKRGHVVLDLG